MVPGYTITPKQDISVPAQRTILFRANEKRKSFTIVFNPDTLPEDDESFEIQLEHSTAGALINPNAKSLIFVIPANDHAGGIISFQEGSLSKNTKEGETVTFYVERTGPALGMAVVDWQVEGVNATRDFVNTRGTITFQNVSTCLDVRETQYDRITKSNFVQFFSRLKD